jgi:adenylate cyclase
MGFPEVPEDTPAFNEVDLDMTTRLGELVAAGLLDDADLLRLTRLLGASFQRIAEAQLDLVADVLGAVPGDDPEMMRNERLTALVDTDDPTLMRLLLRSVVFVWQRHMLAALGRRLDTDADEADTADVAVGFADLSGFTKLSKALEPDELTELVDNFEASAFDVVAASDGRVVKLIGDEVMFVAPTIAEAARIGLALAERLAEIEGMPKIHCGVAFGPTVTVGGDVFGTTVNLASRLTTVARTGTVVIPREFAADVAADPGLAVRTSRRSYSLKGIGDTRIAVVTRSVADSSP